jgi:endonuclease/exonuclease/phosphatase (EEP) superfamily protein YafD
MNLKKNESKASFVDAERSRDTIRMKHIRTNLIDNNQYDVRNYSKQNSPLSQDRRMHNFGYDFTMDSMLLDGDFNKKNTLHSKNMSMYNLESIDDKNE